MPDFTKDEVIVEVAAGESLEQARLVAFDLSEADLSGAIYNKSTKFPDGFNPKAAGMVLVEDDEAQEVSKTRLQTSTGITLGLEDRQCSLNQLNTKIHTLAGVR